jgi:tetratricopeptide (TPR) repeat protein
MFQARMGNYKEALRLLDVAERVKALDDQMEVAKAVVLSKKGDAQGAADLRAELIKRNVRLASVYNDEASAMLAQGRTEQAIAMLERAKKLGCLDDMTVVIHAGILDDGDQSQDASKLRTERLMEPGQHDPVLFNIEAVHLRNTKRYAEALTLLERADKLKCTNLHILTTKASVLELMGRGPEASAIRQTEIQRGVGDPHLYNEEAAYLRRQSRNQEALDIVELAEANLCANDITYRIKADIQQSGGEPEQASQERRDLIAQGTTNSAVYTDEAMAMARRMEFTEAFQIFQLAAKRGIADDYTLAAKATILDMAGLRRDASRFRRKVIDAGRRNVVFFNEEAVYLRDEGDFDGAIALLNKADQLGITNEYSASIRADILSRLGHADAASKICRDWIARGVRHQPFYHMEAIHLSKTGRPSEGLALLDKVVKMDIANRYTETIRRKIEKAATGGKF